MLGRHSKQLNPDLHHRKSTSSTHSVVLEHLDPVVAQRDAQVAAHQAFARAQDRSSAEMPVFPPKPSPTRYTTSKDNLRRKESGVVALGQPSITRRQSVRFVGPCTVQAKGQPEKGQRTRASTVQGPIDPADYGNTAETSTSTLHAPQARPGTSLSATSSAVVGGYIQALIAGDEAYTPEDDIASVPSSYRRLRRSQSMFPQARGGLVRHSEEFDALSHDKNGTAVLKAVATPRPATASETKENIRPPKVPTLRAPKSMSFLRGRHGRNSSINSCESGGTALSTSFGQGPLKSKPSALFGSRARQGQSSLGRTLRTSNSNDELAPQSSSNLANIPRHGGLRNKARKASRSLKDKLKHLFSSSRGDGTNVLPDQHVKSEKRHDDETDPFYPYGKAAENYSQFDTNNGSPYVVSEQQDAQAEILDQVDHGQVADDKSRVTSWTDSGPSTLTSEQQQAWREWEKQRLSIIKENGAHCPSPSLRRPAIGQHILQSQESLLGQPIPPGPTVDSQRVYAALMQRLNETTQLAHIVEQQRQNFTEQSEASLPATKADFEDYQDNSAKPAPLMVRRVTSRGSSTVPYSDLHGTDNALQPAVSSPLGNSGSRNPDDFPTRTEPYGGSDPPGRVVSDRASAFFGSPDSHLFRIESPYRRALRRSMEEAEEELHPNLNTDQRVISDCGTEIHRSQAVDEYDYSESIYSCDEDRGLNPPRTAMTPIVESPNNNSTLRHASLRKEETPVIYRPTNGERINSSVSSVDWKAWLSANVAKLQPSPSPTHESEIVYAVPRAPNTYGQGHVRELAQTGSDQSTPPAYSSAHRRTLPLPPLTPTPTGPDKIKGPRFGMRSSLLKKAPPSVGVAHAQGVTEQAISPIEPLPFPDFGPAPPVPPRSPLRTSSYTASLNNANSMSQLREIDAQDTKPLQESPSLAHTRSVNQLAYAANANLVSPQTPTIRSRGLKLQKKRSGFLYTPSVANSSPGLTAAVEKQFGPASRLPSKLGEGKENIMTPAAKLFTPEAEVKSARSKMVDVFLSSRRKRMASSSNDTTAHDESAAFV